MNKGTAGEDQERALEEGLGAAEALAQALARRISSRRNSALRISNSFREEDIDSIREARPRSTIAILKNGSAVIDEVAIAAARIRFRTARASADGLSGRHPIPLEAIDALIERKTAPPPAACCDPGQMRRRRSRARSISRVLLGLEKPLAEETRRSASDAAGSRSASVGVDADPLELVDQVNEKARRLCAERAAELVSVEGDESLIESTREMIRRIIADGLEREYRPRRHRRSDPGGDGLQRISRRSDRRHRDRDANAPPSSKLERRRSGRRHDGQAMVRLRRRRRLRDCEGNEGQGEIASMKPSTAATTWSRRIQMPLCNNRSRGRAWRVRRRGSRRETGNDDASDAAGRWKSSFDRGERPLLFMRARLDDQRSGCRWLRDAGERLDGRLDRRLRRDSAAAELRKGQEFHDTTLGFVIRFDGKAWRNPNSGASV
jgi:hypothetical protein